MENAKIYRLVCDDGKVYVGSTIMSLEKRFAQHKRNVEHVNSKVYRHVRAIGGVEKMRIELVADNLNVTSRDELLKIEDEFIRKTKQELKSQCLNRNFPRATDDERNERRLMEKRMWRHLKRNSSHDKRPLRERIVEYYRTHKIKRKPLVNLITCSCSLDVPFWNIKRHLKSQIHREELIRWNVLKTILQQAWKS